MEEIIIDRFKDKPLKFIGELLAEHEYSTKWCSTVIKLFKTCAGNFVCYKAPLFKQGTCFYNGGYPEVDAKAVDSVEDVYKYFQEGESTEVLFKKAGLDYDKIHYEYVE